MANLPAENAPESMPSGLKRRLGKYRGKVKSVLLGQFFSVLGLAIGSRVVTEFVTPEALGEYKLAIGIVGLFAGIFFRQFIQFVMRHYHEALKNNEVESFLQFSNKVLRVALISIGFFLVLTLEFYGSGMVGLGTLAALIGFGLLCLNVRLSFQHSVLVTQNRQSAAVTIRTFVQCVTPLALATGAVLFGQNGRSLMLSELVMLLTVVLASYILLNRKERPCPFEIKTFQTKEWSREAVKFVTPLIGVSIFSWALGVADRLILAAYHSTYEVGVYAAVYGLASQPMMLVAGTMAQLMSPYLFHAAAQKNEGTHSSVLHYTFYAGLLSIIVSLGLGFVFGEKVIELLLAKEYRENAFPLFLWIASGYSLLALASSFELNAYSERRTLVISYAYGIAAVVNVFLNFCWIPDGGALGAAKATFFGYLAYFCSIAVISKTASKVRN